jgi:arginyl-tRNA synthetase
MQIEKSLEEVARRALKQALGLDASPQLRPAADPKHGDFQLNAALGLAKQLGKKPRDIAEPWADALRTESAFQKVDVAGPGFVNLTLAPAWLALGLVEDCRDLLHDGIPQAEKPRKIIVDFSSPNIAKQMHVGHLRSTIIGDSIIRLLRATGHDVHGVNHIGDWGTQYGLLLRGMKEFGDLEALQASPISELERIYKLASARAKDDEDFAERARNELVLLQGGAPESLALWRRFVETTRLELDSAYARLGVEFDSWRGESAYNDALSGIVDGLIEKGLAREDQGAIGIFWQEVDEAPPRLKKQNEPFLVRKRDGAFLYSTTDIAALLYRDRELKADEILYVVDARQAGHFEQLFAVGELLGIHARLSHVSFGTVLDENGKPLKTRDGVAVTLLSLLDEAEARARARIDEGVAEGRLKVAEERVDEVARQVGIGAVKYADLRQNRRSDYQFDWDKMLSFQGNAGPYLQYAYARVASIFDRGGEVQSQAQGPIELDEPAALDLGRTLAQFGEAVLTAAETHQPHLLTDHLFSLAKAFMAFYEACPILKAEGSLRQSRLALAALTARQMKRGLGLLGIAAPERM